VLPVHKLLSSVVCEFMRRCTSKYVPRNERGTAQNPLTHGTTTPHATYVALRRRVGSWRLICHRVRAE